MTDDIKKRLHYFFPRGDFSDSTVEQGLKAGEILADKANILPYLQTALFDEKVLEIELDGIPNVYFSRLKDDVPDLTEETEETNTEENEPEYSPGNYLTEMNYITTLPLEPGLGNLHLRQSQFILLRMFTSNFAVEMGTTFKKLAKVGDVPVLMLAFPTLARIVHNMREFRAKVPDSMDFILSIEIAEELPVLSTAPIDISIRGMAFSVNKKEQRLFSLGAVCSFKLYLDDELLASLDGTVRHLSKVRKRQEIEYVCGIEFSLATRTQEAVVESIVASVQRAHLRELSEKSEASGIELIV